MFKQTLCTILTFIDKFITIMSKSNVAPLYLATLFFGMIGFMMLCDVPKCYIENKYGNKNPVEVIIENGIIKEYVFKKYIDGELTTIIISGEDMKIEYAK